MLNKIKKNVLRQHFLVSVCLTSFCCGLGFWLAFMLRFDFSVPEEYLITFLIGLPLIMVFRVVALWFFGVHRGLYRYVSMHDLVQLVKGVTAGTVAFLVVWVLLVDGEAELHMPRAIYFLEAVLSLLLLSGMRIVVRLYRMHHDNHQAHLPGVVVDPTLIVGAGDLGEDTLRIINRSAQSHNMEVMGFVDDDVTKIGGLIHGVKVLGALKDLPDIVAARGIRVLLFCIAGSDKEFYQKVVDSCAGLKLRFSMVPVLKDVVTGEFKPQKMRRLQVEDLLGRKPVALDSAPVAAALEGKTVMITGAGGSIGSELARQITSFAPRRIVLLDSGESPLFEIDRELRQHYPEADIVPVIANIRNRTVLERAFCENKPDYVYHAAAYKHVPLMEGHPDQAVLNNVRGTRLLAEAAVRHECERFVMISTDKAVRPANIMGATKRLCELLVRTMTGGPTVFASVRFGNVLGSNGSVIPIFQKQLEAGGPITVTSDEMTRFFMTIPEAVSLVLQCGKIAKAGDIFVLDMGEPVKIIDLARNMVRLSGLREGEDIEIKVTGLRPGEKMYEELATGDETLLPTKVPKVNVLERSGEEWAPSVTASLLYYLEAVARVDAELLRTKIWKLMALDIQRAEGHRSALSSLQVNRDIAQWREFLETTPALQTAKRGIIWMIPANDTARALCVQLAGLLNCDTVEIKDLAHLNDLLELGVSCSAVFCSLISKNIWSISQLRARLNQEANPLPLKVFSYSGAGVLVDVLDMPENVDICYEPVPLAELNAGLRR